MWNTINGKVQKTVSSRENSVEKLKRVLLTYYDTNDLDVLIEGLENTLFNVIHELDKNDKEIVFNVYYNLVNRLYVDNDFDNSLFYLNEIIQNFKLNKTQKVLIEYFLLLNYLRLGETTNCLHLTFNSKDLFFLYNKLIGCINNNSIQFCIAKSEIKSLTLTNSLDSVCNEIVKHLRSSPIINVNVAIVLDYDHVIAKNATVSRSVGRSGRLLNEYKGILKLLVDYFDLVEDDNCINLEDLNVDYSNAVEFINHFIYKNNDIEQERTVKVRIHVQNNLFYCVEQLLFYFISNHLISTVFLDFLNYLTITEHLQTYQLEALELLVGNCSSKYTKAIDALLNVVTAKSEQEYVRLLWIQAHYFLIKNETNDCIQALLVLKKIEFEEIRVPYIQYSLISKSIVDYYVSLLNVFHCVNHKNAFLTKGEFSFIENDTNLHIIHQSNNVSVFDLLDPTINIDIDIFVDLLNQAYSRRKCEFDITYRLLNLIFELIEFKKKETIDIAFKYLSGVLQAINSIDICTKIVDFVVETDIKYSSILLSSLITKLLAEDIAFTPDFDKYVHILYKRLSFTDYNLLAQFIISTQNTKYIDYIQSCIDQLNPSPRISFQALEQVLNIETLIDINRIKHLFVDISSDLLMDLYYLKAKHFFRHNKDVDIVTEPLVTYINCRITDVRGWYLLARIYEKEWNELADYSGEQYIEDIQDIIKKQTQVLNFYIIARFLDSKKIGRGMNKAAYCLLATTHSIQEYAGLTAQVAQIALYCHTFNKTSFGAFYVAKILKKQLGYCVVVLKWLKLALKCIKDCVNVNLHLLYTFITCVVKLHYSRSMNELECLCYLQDVQRFINFDSSHTFVSIILQLLISVKDRDVSHTFHRVLYRIGWVCYVYNSAMSIHLFTSIFSFNKKEYVEIWKAPGEMGGKHFKRCQQYCELYVQMLLRERNVETLTTLALKSRESGIQLTQREKLWRMCCDGLESIISERGPFKIDGIRRIWELEKIQEWWSESKMQVLVGKCE